LVYFRPVKPNHNLAADIYDWHAKLAGLLYHFFPFGRIGKNIILVVFDIFGFEILLGHFAINAGRSCVDGYFGHEEKV